MTERNVGTDDASQKAERRLNEARRIVVKIGSSLLLGPDGRVNADWLNALAADISELHGSGKNIVLVSSGAIALGRRALKLKTTRLKLEESQAAAAAGQISLAHAYETALGPYRIKVAQILLTLTDTEERRRYLNARSTLETLLKFRAIPIINENDTVATTEIRFGDNDRLAARVAQMISADCLVLLSDVDGLYTNDPTLDKSASHIPVVKQISAEIEAMAGPAPERTAAQVGSGGMITKLLAARICMAAGCAMVIADGKPAHAVKAVREGARATWFLPEKSPRSARKQWIAASLEPKGEIVIDQGAASALYGGKSLLPAGVIGVNGDFGRGDTVVIRMQDGREVGRGLIAYASSDARNIAGRNTKEIENLTGFSGRMAMIHADDLALTRETDH